MRLIPLIMVLPTLVLAELDVRPYPYRDHSADRRAVYEVDGNQVAISTSRTRDSADRVARWYAQALADDGWTHLGAEGKPKVERIAPQTLRIQALAPMDRKGTADGWFDLADGQPARPPLVIVEVQQDPSGVTTVRASQPLRLAGQRAAAKVAPPGALTCARCELQSVITQASSTVLVYRGSGGVISGVSRLREAAAQGGWREVESTPDLPQPGNHTLTFVRGARSCLATVSPGGAPSWRFQAGVVCDLP